MHLKNLRLRNFRCYEDLSIEFDPLFNVIVGVNGTGKTAILEALRIAIGSLFLSVDKYKDKISSPGINQDDVRLSNLEPQYPVFINTEGEIMEFGNINLFNTISWERSLETKGGTTRYINAKAIKDASKLMQEKIREGNCDTIIPLVAYYSTDRFKKEKRDVGVEPDGSRLRGYYNALDSSTNIKFFLDLYYTESLYELQNSIKSSMLIAVNESVKKCIDNCDNLSFDIKRQELLIRFKDSNEQLPFHLLSDGVRSMLAMVMEIAFRCHLLNPCLGENAAMESSGIVLIDEIDLHLHPAWQKKVVKSLMLAFPKIQFIVSTHAPLIIGSLREGKIFSISENKAWDFPLQYGRDANFIINEMGTSEMDDMLKLKLRKYFDLIEKGNGKTDEALSLRNELDIELGINHTDMQRADMMLSFF